MARDLIRRHCPRTRMEARSQRAKLGEPGTAAGVVGHKALTAALGFAMGQARRDGHT